jgi:O-antigen/teichoic acid export membrane protein
MAWNINNKVSALTEAYLPTGSLRARVVLGSFWSIAGVVVYRSLNFIASIMVARILGREGFGELGMIQSTVGLFGVFAGLGLGATATRYLAEYRQKDAQKAGRILSICLLSGAISGLMLALALIGATPWLAKDTLGAPQLEGALALSAALLLLGTYNGAQLGALAGLEAYRAIAWVNCVSGILSFPLILWGTWAYQLRGALAGYIASLAINSLLNYVALSKECRRFSISNEIRGCWREWPLLLHYSLPSFLATAVTSPILWLTNLIIIKQPQGFAELGVFNAVNQMRSLILFLSATAFQPLLPILTTELDKPENSEGSQLLHFVNSYATWILATILTVALLFFAKPIMALFGKDYASGNLALVLVLCSIPIMTYKDGIGRLIQAKALMWYGVGSNMLWGILLLAFTLFFAKHGAAGLAAAYLLAYFLTTFIMVPIYFNRLKMTRLLKLDMYFGLILTSALLVSVWLNLQSLSVWGNIVCFILILTALVWWLKKLLAKSLLTPNLSS